MLPASTLPLVIEISPSSNTVTTSAKVAVKEIRASFVGSVAVVAIIVTSGASMSISKK